MMTTVGIEIPQQAVGKYLGGLVNQFFKILPIKESGDPSLTKFIHSLQVEMLGFHGLIVAMDNDPMYLSLLSILQYIIDHEDCEVPVVKREVFKAISICRKLQKKYGETGV